MSEIYRQDIDSHVRHVRTLRLFISLSYIVYFFLSLLFQFVSTSDGE